MYQTLDIGRFSVALTFWALTVGCSCSRARRRRRIVRSDPPRHRWSRQTERASVDGEAIEREVPIELRPLLPGSDLQSAALHDARRIRRLRAESPARAVVRHRFKLSPVCPWPRSHGRGTSEPVRGSRRPPAEARESGDLSGGHVLAVLLVSAAFSDDPAGAWRSGSGEPRVSNRPE